MNKKKIAWRAGLALLLFLMLVTAVVFLMASSVPSEYRPLQMTKQQREDAAAHLVKRGTEILNKYQEPGSFTHKITEGELNSYLASLEEIAYLRLPRKGEQAPKIGGVYEAMDKAGVADPLVRMSDGILTIMVRTERLRKVISLDISFDFPDADRVKIAIEAVRIGRMPVPEALVRGGLGILKESLPEPPPKGSQYTIRDFDLLLTTVVRGIDGRPLPARLPLHDEVKKIHRIDVTEGELNIQFAPAPRGKR